MATQEASTPGGVSFGTDEETRLILGSLDEFVEREVEPLEDDLGETWTNERKRHEDDGRLVPEVQEAIETVRRRSAEAGFYAMNLDEEDGGEGVSNVTWYRALKHVAAMGPGLSDSVLAGPEGPKPLLAQAEGDQREEFLLPVVRGEQSTGFAQTEPGVGSDSPNMETTAERSSASSRSQAHENRAEREGDEWVIDGTKQWITNAPYADFLQVFARTTPQEEVGRYGGITCFLVTADEYEVGSFNNAVGAVGRQAEVILDDVRVPETRVLGTEDGAFYDAMEFLSLGRLEIGARAMGQAEFLLERAVEYANEREAFGRSIGKFQGVSHKIARGKARQYAADTAGLRLAWEMDRGEQAIIESSIVKYLCTNVLYDIAEDNPYMSSLQTARLLRIVEGTDEIQLNTIAKQLGVN